jgi:hypothetical protein
MLVQQQQQQAHSTSLNVEPCVSLSTFKHVKYKKSDLHFVQ